MSRMWDPRDTRTPAKTDWERMPVIKIETDLWAVMRYPKYRPVAMIMRIHDQAQIAQFLVMTWHPEPHRRRLISMHDTLEAANDAIRWDSAPIEAAARSRRGEGFDGYPKVTTPGIADSGRAGSPRP